MISDMQEELLQLQARSMRDNLVFYNIQELPNENTHQVLRNFLKNEMRISDQDQQDIYVDRVHRVGKKNQYHTRPIVAKFSTTYAKQLILGHTRNLDQRKNFGVNDQLPRELEERKKRLLPKFKEAKRQQKNPRWSVDKLVIGGQVTQVKKDKVADININTSDVALQLQDTAKHSPPKTYNNSSFQCHHVAVNTQDDIVPALHVLYADSRIARATHNIYAYRLQNGNSITEHYEDDGEWGAGRVLLNLLKDNNITNRLVCVTRWYGGTHLGKTRFRYIEEAGRDALGEILTNKTEETRL